MPTGHEPAQRYATKESAVVRTQNDAKQHHPGTPRTSIPTHAGIRLIDRDCSSLPVRPGNNLNHAPVSGMHPAMSRDRQDQKMDLPGQSTRLQVRKAPVAMFFRTFGAIECGRHEAGHPPNCRHR